MCADHRLWFDDAMIEACRVESSDDQDNRFTYTVTRTPIVLYSSLFFFFLFVLLHLPCAIMTLLGRHTRAVQ